MNLESLRALQTRIREATGPDRELDLEIMRAFYPECQWTIASTHPAIGNRLSEAFFFTTDPDGLGACVALMHATLPGCEWVRTEDRSFQIWREIGVKVPIGYLSYRAPLANDCLTFLDAICSAKICELEATLVQEH